MPKRRLNWIPRPEWGEQVNQDLRTRFEDAEEGLRWDTQRISATAPLALNNHKTLVLVTTTVATVTLTLPAAQTVPGYSVIVKKLVAGNTMAVVGLGSELAEAISTTTQYARFTLISDGAAWWRVD